MTKLYEHCLSVVIVMNVMKRNTPKCQMNINYYWGKTLTHLYLIMKKQYCNQMRACHPATGTKNICCGCRNLRVSP